MMVLYGGAFYLAWKATRTPGFFAAGANVMMLGWLLSTFVASMILPPQAAFLATMHFALGYFTPSRGPVHEAPMEPPPAELERQWTRQPVEDAALHGNHS